MAAQLIEKPLTEAQRIIGRLEGEFGMASAAIAREIKVKSDTVSDIKRRKSTGNLQLYRLRRLMQVMETGGVTEDKPTDATQPLTAPIVPDFSAVTTGDDPAGVSLNAEEPAPAPHRKPLEKASDWLRAAMLGDASAIPAPNMTAPSRKRSDSGDAKQSFVEIMTPFTAMVMVLSTSWAIRDPYKPCAPTVDEAQAIVQPIIRRLAHELDIKGRLSENSIDTLTILLATANYGMRAQGTWKQIHAMEVERARSNNRPTAYSGPDAAALAGSGGGPTGGPVYAAPSPADAGAGAGVPDASASLPFWRGGTGRSRQAVSAAGRSASGGADSGQQRQTDALIDELLAQDHAGRVRLGL